MSEYNKNKSVVKVWINELTWKEQTVLFCTLRGTDISGTKEIKTWTRWIRSVVLENAAPNKTFMQNIDIKPISRIAEENPLCLDMLPIHFFGHLLHALEIIGYKHPDRKVARIAKRAYIELCSFFHLNPETEKEMDERLKDEVEVES